MSHENPQNEKDQNERIGLWVSLGVAGLVAATIVTWAVYTNYQDSNSNKATAEITHEQHVHPSIDSGESQQPEILSSIPTTEAQAASLAVANAEQQVKGMDAPAEENDNEHEHIAASEVVAASNVQAATEQPQPVASSAAQAILANENVNDQTQVINDNGTVKFTFAKGKSDVATNTLQALNHIVEGAKNNQKAVILSYSGVEANERLAKERAFAVRSVLLAAGVPESQIEVKEPTTSENDSRRVEVVLQ